MRNYSSRVELVETFEMRVLPLFSYFLWLVPTLTYCRAPNDGSSIGARKYRQRFSVDELLSRTFPRVITGDLDLDVCKAGGFLGDIALPNIEYETEWRQQKLNKSYLEELEKYRDEVLKEGLQVEEEGLTGESLLPFGQYSKTRGLC